MAIGEMQGAETAHGKAGNGAAFAILAHRQRFFDLMAQIAGQRRFVITGAADGGGIHIPAVFDTGHDDHQRTDGAGLDERVECLFDIAEITPAVLVAVMAMQEIEHRPAVFRRRAIRAVDIDGKRRVEGGAVEGGILDLPGEGRSAGKEKAEGCEIFSMHAVSPSGHSTRTLNVGGNPRVPQHNVAVMPFVQGCGPAWRIHF
ncbi:hypothetical protein D3C80_1156930 [compost metagenome]